jgi:hypothetical protein
VVKFQLQLPWVVLITVAVSLVCGLLAGSVLRGRLDDRVSDLRSSLLIYSEDHHEGVSLQKYMMARYSNRSMLLGAIDAGQYFPEAEGPSCYQNLGCGLSIWCPVLVEVGPFRTTLSLDRARVNGGHTCGVREVRYRSLVSRPGGVFGHCACFWTPTPHTLLSAVQIWNTAGPCSRAVPFSHCWVVYSSLAGAKTVSFMHDSWKYCSYYGHFDAILL